MCLIFDYINPVRQFKRGTVYDSEDDDAPFPEYRPDPEQDPDVVETDWEVDDDDNPVVLEPYNPPALPPCVLSVHIGRCGCSLLGCPLSAKYAWRIVDAASWFKGWGNGDLQQIWFAKRRKKRGKNEYARPKRFHDRRIPIPYCRLLHQLISEDVHGNTDQGHESLRRQSYARGMVNAFGKELEDFKGNKEDFRSKVFTPVLQRQLRGIPDSYALAIRAYLSDDDDITIADATKLYLHMDPLHPRCFPSYRRNLVYIREARWHLACLAGQAKLDSVRHFNWFLDHYDVVMGQLADVDDSDRPRIPRLTQTEAEVIVSEGLQEYFEGDLVAVVCISIWHQFPSALTNLLAL
jgi:hypothetical protein